MAWHAWTSDFERFKVVFSVCNLMNNDFFFFTNEQPTTKLRQLGDNSEHDLLRRH